MTTQPTDPDALDIPDCGCPLLWGKTCLCPIVALRKALERAGVRYCGVHLLSVEDVEPDRLTHAVTRDPQHYIVVTFPRGLTPKELTTGRRLADNVDMACDCPEELLSPPCEHVLACNHDLSLEEWADRFRKKYDKDHEYEQPPLPLCLEMVVTEQRRIEIYAERARMGLSLFHPGDPPVSKTELKPAPVAQHRRNGRSTRSQSLSRRGHS